MWQSPLARYPLLRLLIPVMAGIVIADAMNGEITPKMAAAVGSSDARRILIPFDQCDNYVPGCAELPLAVRIQAAVDKAAELAGA